MRSTAPRSAFSVTILEQRPGLTVFEAAGGPALTVFKSESGGHRWQRIPPTEKRGRVHTSTVTVAVLALDEKTVLEIPEREIEWKATVGSGPGGQHRNRTASCVQMKHTPTGITVRIETERSQTQNRELAVSVLSARVADAQKFAQGIAKNGARRSQIGSGQRGDKRRTYRVQDGRVNDHRTGKKASLKRILEGHLEDLAP